MKKMLIFVLAALVAVPLIAAQDPKAVEVGQAMIAAMGGEPAWEHARLFHFDWQVVRDGQVVASFSHWWDRYTGQYRVEGVNKEGKKWEALFNVNTKKGDFFVDGKKTSGDEEARGLAMAYGRFINDTYWVLAPWKIFDPGVSLEYTGQVKDGDGHTCDQIKLSFDNVGLTPKDIYWMDVDQTTHLMYQWEFVLGGAKEAPTVVTWKNWGKFGPIMLSTDKVIVGKPVEIRVANLTVSPMPDESAFAEPR